MLITPIEIRQKAFTKSFKGYNVDEVDAFLHTLSLAWQDIQEKLTIANNDIIKLKEQNKRYESLELSLLEKLNSLEVNILKNIKNMENSSNLSK